jgi:hypothetical protein
MIMTRPHCYRFLLLVIGMLFLAGCSSTRIVTSWKDESLPSGSFKKPLILAVASRQVIRAKLEDEFVRELRAIGVDAQQSYKVFPDLNGVSPDTIRDRFPDLDRDSALVIHLTTVKRETVDVPPQATVYPVGGYSGPGYYNRFGSYYTQAYGVNFTPGHTYEFKIYVLETNLYDGKTEKLVWTVATETEDPVSVDSAVYDFVGVVMKNIKQSRLF